MTDAVPIRERGLPRVSGGDARASRLATALLARLPARAEVTLGGLGRVAIAVVGPVARDAPRGERVSFGLGRPVIEGRLSLDAALARHVAAVVLGADPDAPAAVAPLGFGERGLVAGLVARVLDALGAPLALALDAPARAAQPASDVVLVALDVTAAGARGWAEIDVPGRWFSGAPGAGADPAALGALPVEARLVLARTWLTAGELAALTRGDAVVFDGHEARRTDEETWRIELVVGDHAAAARLSGGGRVQIEKTFGRPRARAAEVDRQEDVSMSTEAGSQDEGTRGEAPRAEATALLAGAPVEVVAEVGRLALRGEEVLALGPGAVLVLGRPRAAEVALRVGDELWAEGELVDVDGALAVRVTRTLRPGLEGPKRTG